MRIISTRPAHQSASWIHRITQANYDVTSLPVLDIVPVTESKRLAVIRNQLQKLDEFNIIIFVSQNAVQYGCDWIDEYWPQFPVGIQGLAVGAKTLEALRERFDEWGVACSSVLPQLETENFQGMNSEELLESSPLVNVKEKNILIVRGCGGRTKLMDSLQSRGAVVAHCEVYHRSLPENSLEECKNISLDSRSDIATFFSGESLENFTGLIKQVDAANWEQLPVVVPSKRVAKLAETLGYRKISVAKNATEESMWDALKNIAQSKN